MQSPLHREFDAMTKEDERKHAVYLFNLLNTGNIAIPARDAEVMTLAKQWLHLCALETSEPTPIKKESDGG